MRATAYGLHPTGLLTLLARPRLQCYQGDHEGLKYVYSGLTVVPEPWSPSVLAVRAKLLELWPDVTFNTCLLNHYRNGEGGVISRLAARWR